MEGKSPTGKGGTLKLSKRIAVVLAIAAVGIVSNLIIFLLVKVTHRSTFRIALWSLIIVNVSLFAVAVWIGTQVAPPFYFMPVFLSYVVSFVFWLAVHWLWSRTKTSTEPVT